MNNEEVNNLNRELKGAHLNILIALNHSEKSLTAVELQKATKWSDKPVRRALEKLDAMGLVEHHGRVQGWTITAKGRAVLLALSVTSETADRTARADSNGGINTQKGSSAGSVSGKYSKSKSENIRIGVSDQIWSDIDQIDIDQTEDIYKHQADLINSDLTQASRENGDCRPADGRSTVEQDVKNENQRGEQVALEVFLKRIGIENPAFDEILARDRLVDVVAWHWFTLGKAWIDNPRGWVIACLKNGDEPKPAYHEFARVWLTMSKENYDDYLAVKHQPIDLEYYWREWELSPVELEVLGRVTRHGGLELFEEFKRPILSNEAYTAVEPRLRAQ